MMIRANEMGEGMARGATGNGGLPPWIIRVHEAGEGSGAAPGNGGLPPWIIRIHEVDEGPRAAPGKGGVPP
jgi:hypothetical protein